MFAGAVWVLTPTAHTDPEAYAAGALGGQRAGRRRGDAGTPDHDQVVA